MKNILLMALFVFSAGTLRAQQTALEQWNAEAKTNIRCLPKYGYATKTPDLLAIDSVFIHKTLADFPNPRAASAELIRLGFHYLYQNLLTAMYRFNQAYLLDSTNSDIYWGYGGVYMVLEDYPRAREQYLEGLARDSGNTRILTDFGLYFMLQDKLDSALQFFSKSYRLDSTNQSTLVKLAVCYYYLEDCKNALYYYQQCKALGGQQISQEFAEAIEKKCVIKSDKE